MYVSKTKKAGLKTQMYSTYLQNLNEKKHMENLFHGIFKAIFLRKNGLIQI